MRKKILIIASAALIVIGILSILHWLILGGAPVRQPAKNNLGQQVGKSLAGLPNSSSRTNNLGSTNSNSSDQDVQPFIQDKEFTISSTTYFDNKQWVVVYVLPVDPNGADPAYIIMQLQGGIYQTIIGPGSSFDTDSLAMSGVPNDVVQYLSSQDLVNTFQ